MRVFEADDWSYKRYWELQDENTVTLPQFIEGTAKGTMKRMFGRIYKMVVWKC